MYGLLYYFLIFSVITPLLAGRFLNKPTVITLVILNLICSTFCSIFIFIEVVYKGFTCNLYIYEWINFNICPINIGFVFDPLSTYMLLIITFISLNVHIFAIDYMYQDEKFYKFLSYLSLFTFFMAFMVASPNVVQFFVGWEGIGLCSYLLINFWYFRPEANRSAMKAIIINKIGDLGLYLFMIFCVFFYRSFDFYVIFNVIPFDTTSIYIQIFGLKFTKIDILSIFLAIAAIGKSSQLILHSWLPDAMEGPTPVSALLHSATMVTAGIFLLIRCSFIIDNSIYALNILAVIGILTSIISSIMAMSQFDIKKSIAYSTTGQLAYMLTGCGFSSYVLSFQHLIDHAFFKAVLFLAAGSVIHSKFQGYQDIREFGKILKGMPITYICFMISSLSLLGFPLTSGFYSKEAIIESIFLRTQFEQIIALLSAVSVAFTAYYSFQLIKLVFFSNNKKNHSSSFKESSILTTIPIVLLTLCGIYFGFLNNNIFSSDTNFFRESIFVNDTYTENSFFFDSIAWNIFVNLPIYFALIFIFISIYIYDVLVNLNIFKLSFNLTNRKFFFDAILFISFIIIFVTFFYIKLFKLFDRFILELSGPMLFQKLLYKFSYKINKNQNADISNYIFNTIFFILVFFILMIFYWLMKNSVYPYNELFPFSLALIFFIFIYEFFDDDE